MSSASRFTTSGIAAIDWMLGVPGLLRDRVGERLVLQVLVLREPLLELHDLERIGGRDEHLGQERVGVEGDRRDQRLELIRR